MSKVRTYIGRVSCTNLKAFASVPYSDIWLMQFPEVDRLRTRVCKAGN